MAHLPDKADGLFGRIAVHLKLITMDQLAQATAIQGRQPEKRLGQILVENGFISPGDLSEILVAQRRYLVQQQKKLANEKPKPARPSTQPPPPDPETAPPALRSQTLRHRTVDPSSLARSDDHPSPASTGQIPLGRIDLMRSAAGHEKSDLGRPSSSRAAPAGGHLVEPRGGADLRFELDLGSLGPGSGAPGSSPNRSAGAQQPQPGVSIDDDDVPSMASGEPSVPSGRQRRQISTGQQRQMDRALADKLGLKFDTGAPPAGAVSAAAPARSAAAPARSAAAPARSAAVRVRAEPAAGDAPPAELVPEPAGILEDERPLAAPNDPHVEWLHATLKHAAQVRASDILFHAGSKAKMRRFGKLLDLTDKPLPATSTKTVLTKTLTVGQLATLERDGEVDLAYAVPGVGRFRVNVFRQHSGLNGAFHYIPGEPPTLAELGLPSSLAKLTNYPQGLLLATGPAGCGKTSTLAALVNLINEERTDHILTVEDPIEYLHPSKRCVVNQRQVARHTESFARALRAALREDPDVICIGELRDLETISLALSAAETGHLVLATLHTSSTIRTVNRIVGAYPATQQSQIRTMLSESLRAVISQRLVPQMQGQGFRVAYELLLVTKAVANLVRENRAFQIHSILQTGKDQGMCLLDDSLAALVAAGHVSEQEAAHHALEPKRFQRPRPASQAAR